MPMKISSPHLTLLTYYFCFAVNSDDGNIIYNNFINNPMLLSLVTDTTGCGICPNMVHSTAI